MGPLSVAPRIRKGSPSAHGSSRAVGAEGHRITARSSHVNMDKIRA